MAIEKATKGQNYLRSLINNYPSSQALKTCANEHYDYLLSGFDLAMRQIATDPDGASWDATTVFEGPDVCQSKLDAEKKVNNPSISALNQEMIFICGYAGRAIDHIVL
ncbi:unnamed protein product [Lathyrus oleraceus]